MATSPIASARSVLLPIVTSLHTFEAASISSGVHPPSGPTTAVADFGVSTSSSEKATAAFAAPGSTSMKAGPDSHLSRRISIRPSKVSGSRIGGTTARPHCLAAEIATRSHRSCRATFLQYRGARLGPCRQNRPDRRCADHDGVAHDVVHLVAFEYGLREGDVEACLGRRIARIPQPHADDALRRSLDDRFELVAAAIEDPNSGSGPEAQHAGQMFGFLFRQRHELA